MVFMQSKIRAFSRSLFNFFASSIDKIRKNRKLSLLINIVLVLGIGLFLGNYLSKEWENIKNYRIQIVIMPLVLSFVLYGVNYLLFIFGWHIILKSYGIKSSLLKDAYIYSSSQIAKTLPTPAWFITGRLVMYQKEGASKKVILTSTFLEMILHMAIGLAILALTKVTFMNSPTWFYLLSIIPIILLVIFPGILNFTFLGLNEYNFRRVNLLLLIFSFVITWILSGPFFQFVMTGLNITVQIPMRTLLQIWILSSIFAYIGSLTLGGIGVLREFSITFLLGNIISPPLAVLVATISRIIMTLGNIFWPLLIMGIIALIKRNSRAEQNIEPINSEKEET